MTTNHPRRIGVCGVGSIGARHARVFGAIPNVVTVLHDAGTDAADLVRHFPGAEATGSFDALLDAGLDGLVVATPDEAHPTHAAAACARGIPVLLEKPVAVSCAAAEEVVAACNASGTPVLVGYVLRYLPCFARARSLLSDGAVGTPVSFHATLGAYETLVVARNRFGTEKRNRLYIDYSHEWDYLRWLLGPIEGGFVLASRAGELPLMQDPNVLDAVLRLRGGATGTAHLDYVQRQGSRACSIIGDRGRLDIDVQGGRLTLIRDDEPAVVEDLAQPRDAAFRAQAEHFLGVAAGLDEPRVTLVDGLAALCVAEALIASALHGAWQSV